VISVFHCDAYHVFVVLCIRDKVDCRQEIDDHVQRAVRRNPSPPSLNAEISGRRILTIKHYCCVILIVIKSNSVLLILCIPCDVD
jgi:hypothetical protein